MRAAILRHYGHTPEIGDFHEPTAADSQVIVNVLAGGLNPVDLSRSSGRFYAGVPPIPSVVGSEGVGRLPDGSRVYFDSSVEPHGSFAERTLIERANAIELPGEVDDALAVSLGIAGVAGWLALESRARVRPGETVVVLGASGVVGQVAVQAARLLGASRVVAVARSAEGLQRAKEMGADATVRLGAVEDLAGALRDACNGGADVIVDPLWGEPLAAALEAANPGARVVQLGQSASPAATISSSIVRGRMLSILGYSSYSVPNEVKREAYKRMLRYAAAGELTVGIKSVSLEDVPAAWERQHKSPHHKIVVIP